MMGRTPRQSVRVVMAGAVLSMLVSACAESDLSFTFEELVDGLLADLREVRPASTDVQG